MVVDPWASERDAWSEYGLKLTKMEEISEADCIIVAVGHNEFRDLCLSEIKSMFREMPDEAKVLIDVKGLYKIKDLKASGINWWRL